MAGRRRRAEPVKDKKRVSAYVSKETYQALNHAAVDRDASITALLCELIEDYLAREHKPRGGKK